MPVRGSHRLHAERYVVCIASLRQRLTPLSDFIQVEATSFEAKEEEARQVTLVKYKDCVQHSKMGGHLKTHGAAVPVFEKHLPRAHEPSCPLVQTRRRLAVIGASSAKQHLNSASRYPGAITCSSFPADHRAP